LDRSDYFKASWCLSVKIVSIIISIMLTAISIYFFLTISAVSTFRFIALGLLPLILLVTAALFTIRGYYLTDKNLVIQRLFWKTKIDLTGLMRIEKDTVAMKKSIRTFGNGGLFSLSGWFRNCKLGNYRAWATDPKRAVVLRFQNRTLVITPDNADRFIEKIRQQIK